MKNLNFLHLQLDLLQRQVTTLTDTHINAEDRTNKAKTEYAVIKAKYLILEEQFMEEKSRAEERILQEQKRFVFETIFKVT